MGRDRRCKGPVSSPKTNFTTSRRIFLNLHREFSSLLRSEYEGDLSVKRLSTKHRADNADKNKALAIRNSLSMRRTVTIARLINNPWLKDRRWSFSAYTDLLYRRLLLHPNYHFDAHASASYELTLGKERETYQREEEERLERELSQSAIRAAIVPYNETLEADEDLDEEDESDNEGFLGWDAKAADDSLLSDCVDGVEVDGLHSTQQVNGSEAEVDDDVGNSESADRELTDDSWDRIEQSEFDADENGLDPFAWARKFIWSEGERIVQSFDPVIIVSIRNTVEGVLLLTSRCLYFHQTGDKIDVMTKETMDEGSEEKIDKVWKLNRLTDVHGRRYMLKSQALELFFADMEGESHFESLRSNLGLSCPNTIFRAVHYLRWDQSTRFVPFQAQGQLQGRRPCLIC